jgi:hypothetical protein
LINHEQDDCEESVNTISASAPIVWEEYVSTENDQGIVESEPTPVWEEIVSENSYVEVPSTYDVYEGREYTE